jgi:hypothetical protein
MARQSIFSASVTGARLGNAHARAAVADFAAHYRTLSPQ